MNHKDSLYYEHLRHRASLITTLKSEPNMECLINCKEALKKGAPV